MATNTASYSFLKPTVGGDSNVWGGYLNSNWDDVDDLFDGTSPVTGIDINGGSIDNTPIGAASASTGVFTTMTATAAMMAGADDTTQGIVNIYGAAVTDGGLLKLFAAGDQDANNDFFSFGFNGEDFRLADDGGVSLLDFDVSLDRWVVGKDLVVNSSGYTQVSRGTTGERPASATGGRIRFNETTLAYEGGNDTDWKPLGGAGLFKGENGEAGDTSNGAGDIFRVHEQTLNTDVTIDADENAVAVGPLTIASGVTLTIASGGTLRIV